MSSGERLLADPVPQAVQALPSIGADLGEELLQLQGEALERLRQPEAKQRAEHLPA